MVKSADYARAEKLWADVKLVQKRMMKEVQDLIKSEQDRIRRELAGELAGLHVRGVSKSAICTGVGISRPTLDKILGEYGADVTPRKYEFRRGRGSNVLLVGELTDTGGFPELEGVIEVRFLPFGSEWRVTGGLREGSNKPLPFSDATRDFLWEKHGDEVLEWHEAHPVPVRGD